MFAYLKMEINMILILTVITFILIKEHKNHIYIFNSFLLERYLKHLRFKKVNIINGENIKKMKKYLKNIFINKITSIYTFILSPFT